MDLNKDKKIKKEAEAEKSSDLKPEDRPVTDDGVIDLEDMTVGTSAEDMSIIELTEELVDEAKQGIKGVKGLQEPGSSEVELTRQNGNSKPENESEEDLGASFFNDNVDPVVNGKEQINENNAVGEDIILREIEKHFPLKEGSDHPRIPDVDLFISEFSGEITEKTDDDYIKINPDELEAALEKVIQKMFADKIETILLQVAERIVSQDIDILKEYLLKRIIPDQY